jgi:hypothetical protein
VILAHRRLGILFLRFQLAFYLIYQLKEEEIYGDIIRIIIMYCPIACRAPQPEAPLVFKLGIHAFLAERVPTSKHKGLPLLHVKSLEADVALYQGLIEAA